MSEIEKVDHLYADIKNIKIAVVGLGFVGLPQALLFFNKGFNVTGVDIDETKIEQLKRGKSYIPDITDHDLHEALTSNRFFVTSDYDVIQEQDVIIICVPTPLTENGLPDLSFLQKVSEELSTKLRKQQLIILESSTYPGTTKDVLLPIVEKSNLTVGKDLFVAYSPERIDPGNKLFGIEEIPKVISGVTPQCQKYIYDLYSKVYEKVVPVSSTEAAEFSKLLENSYRFLNISFINEMAMLCEKLQLDIWEIIDAANTKPYGFQAFYPGPGIGGHCIPVDPLYLIWKANAHGFDIKFLQLANQMNQHFPNYVVSQLATLLSPTRSIEESTILVYGVTYKKDIGDYRESPSLQIMKELKKLGAHVLFHDPFVQELQLDESKMNSVAINRKLVEDVDCVLIATDHTDIPLKLLVENAKLVFDTRNVTKGYSNENIHRIGVGKSPYRKE